MAEWAHPSDGITEQLQNWSELYGAEFDSDLFDLVYDELHRQAHRYLQKERAGHTLQTTALVNEAYLKLTKQKTVQWESRSHFFGVAAMLMRRVLIDYAKTKHRARRGGEKDDLPFDDAVNVAAANDANFDLLALDEALDRLARKDRQMAKIVELRFFSGLDIAETAKALRVSESTVKRDWAIAKAWLHRELTR